MSNYDYEPETTKKDIRLREKQNNCQHSCWICPNCKLYRDNINNALELKNKAYRGMLEDYDRLLTENHIVHISYCECVDNGKIIDRDELKDSVSD